MPRIHSYQRILRCLSVGWVVIAIGCGDGVEISNDQPTAALSAEVIAKVGEINITKTAFEKEWARRNYRDGKQELLEEMIRSAALLTRAKEAGYDRDPEVLARFHEYIVVRFQEDRLASLQESAAKVSEEEIQSFYAENQSRFRAAAAIHAGLIFVKCGPRVSEEARARIKEKALAVHADAARSAEAFARAAAMHSDDQSTRYAGGDIGWLEIESPSSRFPPEVVQAAAEIEHDGETAPLVGTSNGFYIVRRIEKKPANVRALIEVREVIEHWISQEKKHRVQKDFLERMKSGLPTQVNVPVLDGIPARTQLSEQSPPALPKS
jgi:parvulin-like peptidyl-prolyl isomerase